MKRAFITLAVLALAACDGGFSALAPGASVNPATGGPTASPSATPTSSPTNAPGVFTVNPNPVQIVGTGASSVQNISVQEGAYTGAFTESDTCAGVATIPANGADGPAVSFAATGVAVGTCTVTFADSNSKHVSTTINVTTGGFSVESAPRSRTTMLKERN